MSLATIFSGEVDAADVFFLFAVIIGILAAIAYAMTAPITRWAPVFGWAAFSCFAFGMLLL